MGADATTPVGDTLRLDQIIAAASHQLRTPIAHIMGFSSTLLEPDVPWDPETVRDFLCEIHRESQRLALVVSRLLDMSSIQSGQQRLDKDWHEPAALLDRAVASLKHLTLNHVVHVRIHPETADVCVDGPKIERVLCNLIENAVEYSPPGTHIWVTAAPRSRHVQFCVADEGRGIPREHHAAVFAPFFRIDGRPSGAGLGLAICKALVEQHGGRIWLASNPGGGAKFCFSLPASAARRGRIAAE